MSPYLVLLQAGFTEPPSVATGAVRSYRTISPLPAPHPKVRMLRRFAFCCTFRGLTPPRCYLAPCPMEPGLSSTLACSDCLADSARMVRCERVGIKQLTDTPVCCPAAAPQFASIAAPSCHEQSL